MNYLEKTPKSYNSYYKTYRAEWCRKSGLPMYSRKNFDEVQSKGLYTATRAVKEKVSIDESVVCGWYRLPNGYTPLFKEIKKLNREQIKKALENWVKNYDGNALDFIILCNALTLITAQEQRIKELTEEKERGGSLS